MAKSIGLLMDEKPMVGFQWTVIGLCFLINMLDGFDVLVMAFTAASVSSEWGLSGTRLGYLLSAGLVGMALGSLFIAPWADRFGRRPLILMCVTIAGVGMVSSSQATSPEMLAVLRLLTGLGIGGVLASSYVIAGEYANRKWRGLAVSLQSTAYGLGAVIGGLIAAQIIPSMGWRAVFLYGGIATLMTLPVLMLWLPESLAFLASRQPKGALEKINRLLALLRLKPLVQLPQEQQSTHEPLRLAFTKLFSPVLLRSTLLIWLAFFLVMFGFYFVMSWTPRLLVTAGLSNQQGITGGVLLNAGGLLGSTLLGLLATRYKLSRVLITYLVLNSLLLAIFVQFMSSLNFAFGLALAIGVFVNGSIAGLYALTPTLYSASQRVTGLGWAIGIGRSGAILSPLVAGQLIDANWAPGQLYVLFAGAFLLAAVAIAGLKAGPANALKPTRSGLTTK